MKTKKCEIEGCHNSGTLVQLNDRQIYLCEKCRLQLFKALLRENIPEPIKSKFRV